MQPPCAAPRIQPIASCHFPCTLNCLLSAQPPDALQTSPHRWLSGFYELRAGVNEEPSSYAGGFCACHLPHADAFGTALWGSDPPLWSEEGGEEPRPSSPPFPGVFDMLWAPSAWYPSSGEAERRPSLVLACTDGRVRVVMAKENDVVKQPYFTSTYTSSALSEYMLTSATPVLVPRSGLGSSLYYLCTTHTGAVMLHSAEDFSSSPAATTMLSSHAYDGWCGAGFALDWEEVPPLWKERDDGMTLCKGEAAGGGEGCSSFTPLLATGGDDGVLQLFQAYQETAVEEKEGGNYTVWHCDRRCSFDAGVVSIAPIRRAPAELYRSSLHSLYFPASASSTPSPMSRASLPVSSSATPYLLVGSYDESLTLVDVRRMNSKGSLASCSVARKENLGGGVWRVTRGLFAMTEQKEAAATVAPGWVSQRNALVLPLMQGGAGLLSFDVLASQDAVFGDVVPLPADHRSEGKSVSPIHFGPPLAETEQQQEVLVYDTAVLGLKRCHTSPEVSDGTVEFQLCTASFYEKRVDLLTFGPFDENLSIGDILEQL